MTKIEKEKEIREGKRYLRDSTAINFARVGSGKKQWQATVHTTDENGEPITPTVMGTIQDMCRISRQSIQLKRNPVV